MSNLTNDEITERIKFVTMDEEDGVPGSSFAHDMAEEVLQLRAELARLKPLKIAAQEYSVGWTPEFALHQAAREYAAMEYEYARAQAQAGEGA